MSDIEKATINDKHRNLSKAVDSLGDKDDYWYWMKDADEEYVYVGYKDECYRVSYTMTDLGVVTLGEDKEKVIQETTFSVIPETEDVVEKKLDKVLGWIDKHFSGSSKKTPDFPVIKQFEDEKMIVIEPLYIAPFDTTGDIDGHNDVIFEEDVRYLVKSFNENLEKGNLGTKESHKEDVEYFSIIKAWVNECDCYIGDHFVPEGQPLVKNKFNDVDKWEERKNGDLCGVSIGASAREIEYLEVEVEDND